MTKVPHHSAAKVPDHTVTKGHSVTKGHTVTKGRTARNVALLAELFPACVTETRDPDGSVRTAIDLDLLRTELGEHLVEGPRERFHLDWPGKRDALLAANRPAGRALRPERDSSEDFDGTRNLFIEGDNLDALRLLQETYLSKVKVIYIDPPYNTGSDRFVYPDRFRERADDFRVRTGLRGNLATDGRFHSNWLSMMYQRLTLARTLLREDGVLLVSINDVEAAHLRRICDEIFGEANFLTQFVWLNEGNVDQQSTIKGMHEYVLAYARDLPRLGRPAIIDPNIADESKLFNDRIENSITKNGPANPESVITLPAGFPAWFDDGEITPRDDRYPKILDPITVRNGRLTAKARLRSGWSSRNLLELFIANGCTPILDAKGRTTTFALTDRGAIYYAKHREPDAGHVVSVLRNMGTTQQNSSMLAGWGIEFSYPKPVFLIEFLIRTFTAPHDDALVLDFFAGSATTAHAVFRANAADGGNRRFVLVQYPEPCPGFGTIAELARERIRRCGTEVADSPHHERWRRDVGFRSLRIDAPSLRDTPPEVRQEDLAAHADRAAPGRTDEDLLFDVLIRFGVDPAGHIARDRIAGHDVFAAGDLLACLSAAPPYTPELFTEVARRRPARMVLRDAGFTGDELRINAERLLGPGIDLRVL
ncbi:adenine-specific DNA-methyltransferase [Catenuloplanes nepalensis]|uniref:Adenine-specific DNA-methyltransferase n=1 Tax=Catenuloplanes nepalensis TaxID=587533 RepID=A0ABT9N805_9ACTN|nr:site-specific DNA-methyltransferase [Catenuloplanes nepalensis]MDP9799832.1 adenine-specific DNA-methyltransferase [Catenuloplanes nepalensis]